MKTNLKLTTINLTYQPLTSTKLTIGAFKKTRNVSFAFRHSALRNPHFAPALMFRST
jgi:hypothetical protein